VAARRTSAQSETANPPPMQCPWIIASSGFSKSSSAVNARFVTASYAAAERASLRCCSNSEMSAPEANASLP
jgi:hypothetical protein